MKQQQAHKLRQLAFSLIGVLMLTSIVLNAYFEVPIVMSSYLDLWYFQTLRSSCSAAHPLLIIDARPSFDALS